MQHQATDTVVRVALASPDDVQDMQRVLYKAWLVTYPNAEFGITVEDAEDRFRDRFLPERLARRREQIENPSAGMTWLVAKEGDLVVGLCCVIVHADKNQLPSVNLCLA